MQENEISRVVVDGALTVHRALGPGLLESVCELALAHELAQRGLSVDRQVPIPIEYRGVALGEGFRGDLIVEGLVSGGVLLELKSVEHLTALHRKQIQTYLRLTGLKLGLVLNFGAALMKDGIVGCVNDLKE
ncbi:MAG: GxxExxY protein [Thiohalocapsa sp.]